MVSVVQLGTIDYTAGLQLQEKLVELRKADLIPDVLLLLEHTPVITLGRNAKAANILTAPELLAARGVQVFECNRGGDVTFHGPGQLVAYPIFDLRSHISALPGRKTLGVIEFVRRLEDVLMETCAGFEIPTQRLAGLTGVWTTGRPSTELQSSGTSPDSPEAEAESKIAAIGVHISRGVTSHGLALNVNTDLDYFKLIVPCGISSRPVTSIAKELGRQVAMAEVVDAVVRNFASIFKTEVHEGDSLETLLGNDVGIPMRPPTDLRKLRGEEETFWA